MTPMWIGGESAEADSKEVFPVENPATEEIVGEVPRARAPDVDRAVKVASEAFERFRHVPGLDRAEQLHEVARKLREQKETIAYTLTLEGGKPLLENRDEVEWCAGAFDYYAEVGRNDQGRVIAPVREHQFNFVLKEPYGVVAAIVPWNYPLLLLTWKLAPALAAGNTVVVKPSELTPLSTLLLKDVLDGLPKGVVNIVTGYGGEAGEALVTHPRVDVVAFTGSVQTGRQIAMKAAEQLKKVHLELGGNDPFIVCDDVDIDIAARGAAFATFLNMGQVCTSAERFYVFEKVYEPFLAKLTSIAEALRIGDPLGPDIDLGPLASAAQRAKVERKLAEATANGAKVVTGGARPKGRERGYFFQPTVLTGVDPATELFCEETFGPIAPVAMVKDIEEATRLANSSRYGLGASIYTNNLEYAMTAASRIRAGTFWINDPLTDNDAGPFGGMRLSGIGRELGVEGLEGFRDTKHIHMDYKIRAMPDWFPYKW
ncbi:MAG TPA: aldehyde dehydrogenase family protein [Vicinamibacteria bacterium]|nr:aldehyde dehydrogenase family protein [Vicinamibacteria bacterium]